MDKLLYKDRYDYRKIIQTLSASLHSAKDFTDASRLIVGTLVQSLNLAGGCLLIGSQAGSYAIGVFPNGTIQCSADVSSETDPMWTGNWTNVAFTNTNGID